MLWIWLGALKIDRSFVNELGLRQEVDAMVHSLVTLAHNFGMKVIAEGVETEEQMALITEIGCNEVQGYLLGKPMSDPRACLTTSACSRHFSSREIALDEKPFSQTVR
jgi:EAL domain-containing protein (putative c-di-GMP-specific phosphodiesterase class I)